MKDDARKSYAPLGAFVDELIKLLTLLAFAALVLPRFLPQGIGGLGGYALATLVLLVLRFPTLGITAN